jgi:uncharacterized membrane protein YgcG
MGMHLLLSAAVLSLCAATTQDPPPGAQQPAPKAAQDPAARKPDRKAAFTAEQLEQIVAPIALYDDALLAQTMMAATYPLEIVQAARWVKKNPSLKGDALEKALQDQKWDPSVKGLCGLPAVLDRLNDNLDWTQDLGDAFLADQSALMDAVQKMRRKAMEAGNLKSGKEQKVTEREDKIIVVESADPQTVYVPTYYPTVVYGSSWYYPYWYYPPMYVAPPPAYPAFTFAAGVVWGAAIWGGCSWGWGHNECNIQVNHYNNFVDRTERPENRPAAKDRGQGGKWQHQPEHRQGVRYRDQGTSNRYGGAGVSDRMARDQARGYGGANRPSTQPAGGANRPATQPAGGANRPSTQPAGGANRPSTQPAGGQGNRATQPKPSTGNTGQRSGSFSGASSASSTRAASSRGSASRGGGGGRGGGGRR